MTFRSGSGCELVRVRRSRRRHLLLILVALSIPLAACSGSGGDDEAQPTTTTESLFGEPLPTLPSRDITEGTAACGLLRSSEIEEATGLAVNSGRGIEREGSGSSCTWSVRADSTRSVSVAATPGDREAFRQSLNQSGPRRQLSGVGEGALVGGGGAVAFTEGTLVIVTVNTDQSDAAKEEAAEALIRAAVPRV